MENFKKEIERRRTFAIISHPDAGKTTLTEKLLLYGGAILQAGAVKGKAADRHAVSDWMELEKKRGISITSSVMQFQYEGYCINILDTPGHQDFSEDTYRTLMAADSAVMVIDAAKGIEPQTRKLFKVCAMRGIPIFTFINKLDREARDPFDLIDELEKEFGIGTYPMYLTEKTAGFSYSMPKTADKASWNPLRAILPIRRNWMKSSERSAGASFASRWNCLMRRALTLIWKKCARESSALSFSARR